MASRDGMMRPLGCNAGAPSIGILRQEIGKAGETVRPCEAFHKSDRPCLLTSRCREGAAFLMQVHHRNLPRVIVIGGGFGGLCAARGLKDASVRVTLLDRENHHLFQPLLY